MSILNTIETNRMRPYQWFIVCICMVCNMLDGFDFFAMGFVLPHLEDGFASSGEKGFLISTGLVGMAIGAIFIAPLADRYGRRTLMLLGLALNSLSMVATALSPTAVLMMGGRLLTGIGVGVISAMIIVTAQEFSSTAKRNLAVGIVTIGFPLGSTLAGLTGVSLISVFGGAWQAMFWVGAIVSGLGFFLVYFALPESLSFLINRGEESAGARVERITRRIGIEGSITDSPVTETAVEAPPQEDVSPKEGLLGPTLRQRTLLLWVGYGFLTAAYYFVGTWTPQLISDASGDTQRGAVAGTIISVGSLAGSVIFGIVGLRLRAIRIACASLIMAVISILLFATTMGLSIGLFVAALLGLSVFVAISSYTAAAPPMYPPLLRARGYGYMVGISRIGAILTPIIAGYASVILSARTIFLAAAVLLGVSALAAIRLSRLTDHGTPGPEKTIATARSKRSSSGTCESV